MLNILYERLDARTNVLLWKLALSSWFSIRMVCRKSYVNSQLTVEFMVFNNCWVKIAFISVSYLCLWDMFPLTALCPWCDQCRVSTNKINSISV